ncbi:MAG: NAD(P)/FAD-dependent oxidoreductase [Candidatus Aquicultor sp.]
MSGRTKDVVVIGCGFAGMEAALLLRALASSDMNISVVSSGEKMVYTPSLIWLPPRRRTLEEISIEIEPVLSPKRIKIVRNDAAAIEPDQKQVILNGGDTLRYDYLVIAAGWRSKRSHIRGSKNVLFPCDIEDALKLTDDIDAMEGGSITFAIEGERPGPGAEFLGWIDIYLRTKGVRDNFTLNLADEKHMLLIHLGREACIKLTANFEQRGINLYLGKRLIAARPGTAFLEGGTEVPSDLICAVGKLEAPPLLRRFGSSGPDGFIPVNADLTSMAYPDIYVAGDATWFNSKTFVPKVATLAIDQGQIAATNIQAQVNGTNKVYFSPEDAVRNLYLLSDFGYVCAMAQNYKTIRYGSYLHIVKESIERYYLYTHRRGIPWHFTSLEKSA